MKLLKLTMAVLLVLCLTAVSAYSEVIWSEDFESYEAGTEIVGTVEGWKYFNPAKYSGTSTVVADGSGKVIKLSRVEEQSTNDYDMIFTPGIKLAPSEPLRQLTKVSFSLKSGSETDLFALYGIVGGATNRYFYMAFNGNAKSVGSWPSNVEFTNLTDGYNDCFVVVDYLNKKVVKMSVNGEEKDCDIACGDDVTEDVVLRLSTQYNSFFSADKAAYFDNLQIETIPRSDVPVISAPDSVTMGAKGKFTICNAGPDATINYTISTEADWLTINPTSGELTTVKDINLRCSQPRGFYKTTLTVDGGEYGSKTVKVVCQNGVVYATTFEEFNNGDIIAQADEWTVGYGSIKAGVNEAIIVDGGYDGSTKALRVHADDALFAPHINFTGTENHSSSNNFKVSFMLKVENLSGNSGNSGIFFNSTDGLGEIALYNAEDGCRIEAKNAEFATTNVCAWNEWIPVSYTLNTTIDNKKLLEFQFGDCIYSNLDIKITSETDKDRFRYFRFFIWAGGTSVLMDNFSLEYVPRQSIDNKISIAGTKTYDIYATNGTLRVFNEGSVDTEVTVESPYDFLTFGGQKKVTITISPNSSKDLTIDLDRSTMGNDYYVGEITVANDSMTLTQPVMIQSGVEGVGYTFYKSYFDTLEEGIDIREQDSAWVTGYGTPPLCPITEKSGFKCLELAYNDYNALHCTIKSPTGLSEKYNYRVSFMAYIPAGWDGDYSDFWVGFQTGGTYFEQSLQGHADGNNVTFNKMGNTAELGKWFDVSYTFNTIPGAEKHLETVFNNIVSNFNDSINFESKDSLNYWRFFGWCGDSSAPTYIKDVVIEAVARPETDPKLEVAKIGRILYADRTNAVDLAVINGGGGNLSFSAEVTRGGGWLSIKGADPETGILEDTIEGTGVKKYPLIVDFAALGNTYGWATITVTGAGSTKTTDLYIQNGDDTGITFYKSYFDEMEFGKDIREIDPAWVTGYGEPPLCPIAEMDGSQCLKLAYDNYNALHCAIQSPKGLSDRYDYRVSFMAFVPADTTAYADFWFGFKIDDDVCFEQSLMGHSEDGGYVTFANVDNTAEVGIWVDVSYTMNLDPDPVLGPKLLETTFNGETTKQDMFINLNGKDYFSYQRIFGWCDAGSAPLYIKDLVIEAVGKPDTPPVMDTNIPNVPVPYAAEEFEVLVRNIGGNSFHFTVEPGEGVDYLTTPTDTFEVFGYTKFTVKIDRSKLGYGFYRPTLHFTTDIEGQESVVCELPIQSGSPEEGYVLYASSFNALHTTKEEGGEVVGELSDQDPCWLRCSNWNRADIVFDPAGSGNKVAKFINANDWATYSGYQLNLGIPAEAAQDYDVVYSMDMYIPKTYVDHPESEHPGSAFCLSQGPENRQCEVQFWLDEEKADLPVVINPADITTAQTWWADHVETATPVESESWFRAYMRFSTKLIDFDHKNLWAITFGENEYQMEGEDCELTYPGGIGEDELDREDLGKLKLFSYCDDANVCIDNVNILLVPKGLPEPAFLGILALLALAFARKQR